MADPLEESIGKIGPDKWVMVSVTDGIVDMEAEGMTAFEVYELLVQALAVVLHNPRGGNLTGMSTEDTLGPLGISLGFTEPE